MDNGTFENTIGREGHFDGEDSIDGWCLSNHKTIVEGVEWAHETTGCCLVNSDGNIREIVGCISVASSDAPEELNSICSWGRYSYGIDRECCSHLAILHYETRDKVDPVCSDSSHRHIQWVLDLRSNGYGSTGNHCTS